MNKKFQCTTLRHFKRQTDGIDNETKPEKCLQNLYSEFKLALSIFPEAIIKQHKL